MLSSKTSRISVGVACLVAAIAGASASAVAAESDTAVPSYQEFKASTYQDVDGAYVVNGDEIVSGNKQLKEFYDKVVAPQSMHDGLIVNTVGGVDDKWSASQVANLTYCVSTKFGTRHDDIVAAMATGGGLWEAASSKVNFVYVPAQDGKCTTRNKNVLFSVEPVQTTQYIARAFFPSSPKSQRNVLVDDSIWSSGSWTPGDVLGHELGHTLGFRHEHTRPESGTCFEDNNWRPLTPYDSSSIMHYPQCNGGSANLKFQASDAEGVRALYGS
ncbi:M57 family metalloprotease [Nocardioides sp. LML1-1-1.1]|uniref:M57 family metalloprotease n=1 Tax=Nocardioides sp. LML1-1-1.1 TaxID=3135248 RepID=UPI00342763AF